jgi:SAM-dependent methyltransferase
VNRATLFAVAAVSGAIVAYELLLMRLFSIVWWHHFAYMIISIALLGFGASGTVLALARERLMPRFEVAFATSAALFAATAVLSSAAAIRVPFNALAVVWDPRQLLWLGVIYLLVVLPFFFGGGALGLALARFSESIGRVYAFDLVGAGLGAIGVIGLLFALSPTSTLRLVAAAGLVAAAAALAGSIRRRHRTAALAAAGAALGVALWLPPGLVALHPYISQYKGLATALLVPDARIVDERSSPLGLVSTVESPTIPFRHAPGLSLNNVTEPPPQLGIFTDADSLSAITRFEGDREALAYLDYTPAALAHHLMERPKVLVLGVGGGEQVLLALYHAASKIVGVEMNPQILDLVRDDYAEFAGGILDRPDVSVHMGEARGFVRRTRDRYDLIQIPLLYSFGAAAGGTQGLHESYAYTTEAFRDYLRALNPGGILSVTLWLKLPPRDAPKLFATALEALKASGVADPGRHLALIRSWKTTTLLVKNAAFRPEELATIREFAAERSFDVAYLPGMSPAEANRYNLLERPYFYEAANALAGAERQAFIDSYKFNIEPASDDRPYFFDFFRWRFLPELIALRTQGAAAMLDMGYLILFATLMQAALLSVLLIVAPLVFTRRPGGRVPRARIVYFLALGLAFLLVEIAFMQRFILFLGHPIYAVAVVLAGFLVFAGLGSAYASWLARVLERRATAFEGVASALRPSAVELAVAAIAALSVLYLFLLPQAFEALIRLPDPAKVLISLGLIAPLAWFMGMPFPLGIRIVAGESADLVPWAWAINGCASVIAAVLATLLAIHFGFTIVVLTAVALYVAAALALGRRGAKIGGAPFPPETIEDRQRAR